MKALAGFLVTLALLSPTIGKAYEGFVGSVGGSSTSTSKSIFPKSEVPSTVNGIHWSKALDGDNAEKMAGLK